MRTGDMGQQVGATATEAAVGRVTVVTDSSGYLPPSLVEQLGIEVVSLYYALGARRQRESDAQGDFVAFYEELEKAGRVARTDPPRVDDFKAVYAPLLANGGSVVSIHISSAMSDTCRLARTAAHELRAAGLGGERVEVVDSAGTCGHLGVLVLAAARAAAAGGTHEEVLERVRCTRQEVKLWFLVDTLEYLQRGGRIGTAASWIGSTLNVKPILTLESEITAVERVRTRERGIERLVDFARQRHAMGADAWFVQHARAADAAGELADRLREIFWREPEFVSEIGPVVGTHVGPGVLVVGGVPSRFLEP